MIENRTHWEKIYRTKKPDAVSWFQPSLRLSLVLIRASGVAKSAAIIDVGAGASTLVDDLLTEGYSNLTILDISSEALSVARQRLGERSKSVKWIVSDITELDPSFRGYEVWHDRAVFHFLTAEADRRKYCEVMERSVCSGGFIIMATFGPNGPTKCSGLNTVRYSPESLSETLGNRYQLISARTESHVTPGKVTQEFAYSLFRKQ